MTDLLDLAKPVRDAAIAEVQRLLATQGGPEYARDANVFGVHLTAVLMAFTSERHKLLAGVVRDPDLIRTLAGGVACVIANVAMAFRPIRDGVPISADENAMMFMNVVVNEVMRQISICEQGLHDFVVPVQRDDGGALQVKPFDVFDMLKGEG